MTQYSIKKKDIFQETDEPEADYDLMTVIIIRREKGTEKERYILKQKRATI